MVLMNNVSCLLNAFLHNASHMLHLFQSLLALRSIVWFRGTAPCAWLLAGVFFGASALIATAKDIESNQTMPSEQSDTLARPCSLNDVWELSTRHLPDRGSCINSNEPGFSIYRYSDWGWQAEQLDTALDLGDRLPILYVHGNFMERGNARQRVLIINNYLQRRAKRPYRLMMLSWPSQREQPLFHDVFDNAAAAECQALYLAWLLERLGHVPQVSLLGFSFGSRTVTGGLHLVAGGGIRGLRHEPIAVGDALQSSYRVGLVAPALDRNWLTPRGKHGEALDRVDMLVNLYNSQDPVLKRFRFLDRVSRPTAAGFTGFVGIGNSGNPRSTEPLDQHARVIQYDCGTRVGNTHDEKSYYGRCPTFGIVIDNLLWEDALGSCVSR
jgi:hypothetical protein